MALMIGAAHGACKDANATDEKARKAADEMVVNNDAIAIPKGKVDFLSWMVGFNLALTIAVLFMVVELIPHP